MTDLRINKDAVARMAIRLGRAYEQAWAKSIKTDEVWNWSTATKAIDESTSQRKPEYRDDKKTISYEHGSTCWLISRDGTSVIFRSQEQLIGSLALRDDNLIGPHLVLWLENIKSLDKNNLWRVDRAITSLSCLRWKPLYSLPPVGILADLFEAKLPECPIQLHYLMSEGAPTIHFSGLWRTEAEKEQCAAFDRALRTFERRGGMSKWPLATKKH